MNKEFKRIAIVNRGEPAMRLIVAAREWNERCGGDLRTIALFTEPDRKSMFVREADEAVCLGPATFVTATGERKSSYLDYDKLKAALVEARAEAVWVGWGFVAEHAAFVDMVEAMGIVFIGPNGEMMRRVGDKISSKFNAEAAQVPVAPWSNGPVASVEEATQQAERLGYPLVIKATAGGGGRGIRRVDNANQVREAFETARSEAKKAFGDPTVFIERMVLGARHIEVQIIADNYGNTWSLGVRDCTIQRRNQKILEETPSPALTAEEQRDVEAAAVRMAKGVGYRNAGTVEFLFEEKTRSFFFMEVNTRLQVEHPVTELTTGADLVNLQIHVARGGKLEGEAPRQTGHAIELRLNAEDPEDGFAPAPGFIERLRFASGPGIRVDTGVAEGDTVPPDFDSMIAKVMARGATREEAIGRLARCLSQSTVVLRNGMSNKSFLLGLLRMPEVRASKVDVNWMDRLVAEGKHVPRDFADVALLTAAVEGYDAELDVERAQFYASAARGRPEVGDKIGRKIELSYLGAAYDLFVSRLSSDLYRVDVDGERIELRLERYGSGEEKIFIGDRDYRVLAVEQGLSYLVEVEGVAHRLSRDQGGMVRSPAPAVVVNVLVKEGDIVSIGDPLVVVEAMKMEMTIEAKFGGRVREVSVINNVQVQTGAPLLMIEPVGDKSAVSTDTRRLDFTKLVHREPKTWSACRHNLSELRTLAMGYDARVAELKGSVEAGKEICSDVSDPKMLALENEILDIFVDTCALLRRRIGEEWDGEVGKHSSEEYLFTFLRDLSGAAEKLPESFMNKLRRSVRHYGLTTLDRTPELEECLFRISKAYQRIDDQLSPILSLLQTRLDNIERVRDSADESFRILLERLGNETQGRFPGVNDLARELRYHLYDKPLQEHIAQRALAEAEATLRYLSDHPDAVDRAEQIQALVACPQPLKAYFARKLPSATPTLRRTMLEVLMRRYYRIRNLDHFEIKERSGVEVAITEYDLDQKRIRVLATQAVQPQLSEIFGILAPLGESCPENIELAIDVYAYQQGPLREPDKVSEEICAHLNRTKFPHPIRRVLVAITGEGAGRVRSDQHFTFREKQGGGFEEDKLCRGWHPLLGRRLQLWRLSTNFELNRVPTDDNIHLFHAVGRTNRKDERLIAFAEVRDLTQVRDDRGKLLRVPSVERLFSEALAGIRRFQAQRPSQSRLQWNRVHLFVWPPIEFSPDELNEEIHKLADEAEGLGLERFLIQGSFRDPTTGKYSERVLDVSSPTGSGLSIRFRDPPQHPMQPLSEYTQKVVELRSRGLTYPYELIRMLAPERGAVGKDFPPGEFQEYDLGPDQTLVPVNRAPGLNSANMVVGIVTNFTEKYPEGMARVALLGDPSRGLGSLAEPECRVIMGALDLAEEKNLPLEWYAVSAGAKISMESGTENMDWIAAVLRRLIEFTQRGGEVNVVVCGVNVGAQPYWNAEATMLMHTRGILIMTSESSMVLTGKRALDYSGGVSAEDNEGIGGYERIMGPNGQAQYFGKDIAEACKILLQHYEHAYVLPGERFPRRARTLDPFDRDPGLHPHGQGFATVGEIFSEATNPGRKKPFDIRKVMRSVIDQDHAPLERWANMRDAETAAIWDAHIGGYPVCLIGFESHPLRRMGVVPADGPSSWTSGTLFPKSSKKVARSINSASGNRPLVVLANLSGFDGSPESMRETQLEFGAEIGRAVVNFKGPIVFTVISRYHGGAFVVFSGKLNEQMEIAALDGTHASVIGGAPAAAVVFAGQVKKRVDNDPRVLELQAELKKAEGAARVALRDRLNKISKVVYAEKMREVADEFDAVHSVQRALKMGSVHRIIPAISLRSYVIEAIGRGIERTLAQGL